MVASSPSLPSMQTTNHMDIALPFQTVSELYTCHDLLPSWSLGFVSLEVLCDGTDGSRPRFRQRYRAMGKEIDEVLTLMENNLPHGFCVVAEQEGVGTRESVVTFEAIGQGSTRVVVRNHFRGDFVPHLVKGDLQDYTQKFLEAFKAFAESREA